MVAPRSGRITRVNWNRGVNGTASRCDKTTERWPVYLHGSRGPKQRARPGGESPRPGTRVGPWHFIFIEWSAEPIPSTRWIMGSSEGASGEELEAFQRFRTALTAPDPTHRRSHDRVARACTRGLRGGVRAPRGVVSCAACSGADAERWLKTVLATLLRDDASRRTPPKIGRRAWCEGAVPSAGRFQRANPETWVPTGAFVEGEQLLERLRAVPDQPARWRSLYLEDEMGLSARLNDPAELGEAYAFDAMLGGVDGWTSLARVGAGDPTALTQLVERVGAHWVLVRGREDVGFPSVLDALSAQVARDVHVVPPSGTGRRTPADSLQGEAAVVFVAEDEPPDTSLVGGAASAA